MRPRLGTALSAPEKCVETLALTLCRPASKNRAAQALNNFLAATIDRQPALARQLLHSENEDHFSRPYRVAATAQRLRPWRDCGTAPSPKLAHNAHARHRNLLIMRIDSKIPAKEHHKTCLRQTKRVMGTQVADLCPLAVRLLGLCQNRSRPYQRSRCQDGLFGSCSLKRIVSSQSGSLLQHMCKPPMQAEYGRLEFKARSSPATGRQHLVQRQCGRALTRRRRASTMCLLENAPSSHRRATP
jgi:hypothetical protein